MQRYEITLSQKLVECHDSAIDAVRTARSRVRDDLESQGPSPPGHVAANPSQPNQAEYFSRQARHRGAGLQPVLPLFRSAVKKSDLPRARQKERQRMVGDFGDAVVGNI